MNGPWLRSTCGMKRLIEDLRSRDYLLWWSADSVTVTGPGGWRVVIALDTTSGAAVRNAYASAQEHANSLTVQQLQDQQREDAWML